MTKLKETKKKEESKEPKKKVSSKTTKESYPSEDTEVSRQGGASLKTTEKEPEVKVRQEVVKEVKESGWREEIKGMLVKMRKELLQDVSQSIKNESDYLRFDVGDFYDHASDDRDRELSLMITDRDRDKLVQIDEALKKVEDGSYGVCDICGDDIGEDRLRAMPFAKLCLSCKIDLERQGRDN